MGIEQGRMMASCPAAALPIDVQSAERFALLLEEGSALNQEALSTCERLIARAEMPAQQVKHEEAATQAPLNEFRSMPCTWAYQAPMDVDANAQERHYVLEGGAEEPQLSGTIAVVKGMTPTCVDAMASSVSECDAGETYPEAGLTPTNVVTQTSDVLGHLAPLQKGEIPSHVDLPQIAVESKRDEVLIPPTMVPERTEGPVQAVQTPIRAEVPQISVQPEDAEAPVQNVVTPNRVETTIQPTTVPERTEVPVQSVQTPVRAEVPQISVQPEDGEAPVQTVVTPNRVEATIQSTVVPEHTEVPLQAVQTPIRAEVSQISGQPEEGEAPVSNVVTPNRVEATIQPMVVPERIEGPVQSVQTPIRAEVPQRVEQPKQTERLFATVMPQQPELASTAVKSVRTEVVAEGRVTVREEVEVRSRAAEGISSRETVQVIMPTMMPIVLPHMTAEVATPQVLSHDVAQQFVLAAQAVVDAMFVSSGFVRGEGQMLIRLRSDVLGGSEVHLVAKAGTLTVVINPATQDVSMIVEANRTQFEQYLAEKVQSWRVSVAVKRGERDDERL